MTIVKSLSGLVIPDVYILEVLPTPKGFKSLPSGIIGMVGVFERGQVGVPVTVGDEADFVRKMGNTGTGQFAGANAYMAARKQGASNFRLIRVLGSGYATASLVLKDRQGTPADTLKVKALYPGVYGNSYRVEVANGSIADTFKLILTGNGANEIYDNLNMDPASPRYALTEINGKSLNIALEDMGSVAVGANRNPAVKVATSLASGSAGSALTDQSYIGSIDASGNRTGLKALEPVPDVEIIHVAEVGSQAVNSALITHAQNFNRFAVLNTPRNQTVDDAVAAVSNYDTDFARMVYGWYLDDGGHYTAGGGYECGIISVISPHESPSGNIINGILQGEIPVDRNEAIKLTTARMSAIVNFGAGWEVVNGVTLSTNPELEQVYRRRMTSLFEREIPINLRWAKSKPHTYAPKVKEGLREKVRKQLEAYFENFRLLEMIESYQVIADESNNTPETMAGKRLMADPKVKLWNIADFIVIRLESGANVEVE